ncbi:MULTISPECIES: flagellar export chaperone FliS [Alcaligenes]|jgi:flagellar protein FliS|uniref:Flagellar secretion chaperone FliS n=3 Tax=Alcaligenes TaxID=507 RepID=A0A3G2HUH7_9BURK|nr:MULTISPECIES: flagellar export chaperone FliS [Alcaligenes]ASR89033.1 flagellar export chaperone FliS [Alcaligenes faecalis]AWG33966.1 flagellar export chaperone FliS [Alcaligenes aquatilis]AYN20388.1 flagellar export chaperone FliS [Alcaligenes aquatilis]MCC9163260.1 flagellar export chaperone FliS [Alcaligenes sp. MMA]MCH4225752.1 flagellar export chaperone FliS [Alcaligenes faecalis]
MSYPAPSRRFGQQSVRAYAQVGLETEVLSASPEHLITLLFNGARTAMLQARLHMEQGNIAGRGQSLSKAIDIVDSGLKMAVDTEKGGELARNLVATYDLILHNLMLANLRNDAEKLALAERLLTDIADAWRSNVDTQRAKQPA